MKDLKQFRATEGSTEQSPFVFGVGIALLSTSTGMREIGMRGGHKGAKHFIVGWNENKAQSSPQRKACLMWVVPNKIGGGRKQKKWKETRPRE